MQNTTADTWSYIWKILVFIVLLYSTKVAMLTPRFGTHVICFLRWSWVFKIELQCPKIKKRIIVSQRKLFKNPLTTRRYLLFLWNIKITYVRISTFHPSVRPSSIHSANKQSLQLVLGLLPVGRSWNISPGKRTFRHLKQMPEPPQLAPLDVEEQWLYSKPLPDDYTCAILFYKNVFLLLLWWPTSHFLNVVKTVKLSR